MEKKNGSSKAGPIYDKFHDRFDKSDRNISVLMAVSFDTKYYKNS